MARRALLFVALTLFLMAGTACRSGDENAAIEGEDGSTEVKANKAESEEDAGLAGEPDSGEAADDADAAGYAAGQNGEATRVAFEAGAESARIAGGLGSDGAIQRYVLQALAGQQMALRVRGVSNGAVVLSVHDASGELLATTAGADWNKANELQLDLTSAGDHTVSVSSGADAPSLGYDLEISITGEGEAVVDEVAEPDAADEAPEDSDAAAAAEGSEPLPIFFDTGETSAVVEGRLSGAGALRSYILRASAGQRMELSLESVPAGQVDAMVFNPGGRPMRSISREAMVFDLVEGGDYTVSASSSADNASYKLNIAVMDAEETDSETDADADGADASDAETSAPTRVLFQQGEASATYSGTLWDGGSHRYVLGAAAGQSMRIELVPDAGAAFQVTVEDKEGNLLASGLEGNALELDLPNATDYIVKVLVAPGATEASYTITMGIE